MSCTELEVVSSISAIANIRRWTITSDDIYLLKFNEKPPGWLEDIIINTVDQEMGLVDDLSNLESRFANIEEGYTNHYFDWMDGDKHTLSTVESLYTTNAEFNAGINSIKTTYVSKAEAGASFDSLIGAWQTGAGGAWFNEQVSVVSNVAYSAAKSASTLTATLKSQQDELLAIAGDIAVLEKQIDGKVETWKGEHLVINTDGTLIPTAEPYVTWLADDTLPEHTGDTYLLIEPTATGEKLLGVFRFGRDTVTDKFNWFILEDDLAAVAYQQALDAGVLADGKVNTFYQATPPNIVNNPTMGCGDLWLDSDDGNKMYRYQSVSNELCIDKPTDLEWLPVIDKDITASVRRLDEATVDVGGVATAKSSLTVDADGNVAGFVASASSDPDDPGSEFRIFAHRFVLASEQGQRAGHPFTVDTNGSSPANIKFNGRVEFANIDGGEGIVTDDNLEYNIANNVTTIDGGNVNLVNLNASNIKTGSMSADRISAGNIYNTGGNAASYNMRISLDDGYIHIK